MQGGIERWRCFAGGFIFWKNQLGCGCCGCCCCCGGGGGGGGRRLLLLLLWLCPVVLVVVADVHADTYVVFIHSTRSTEFGPASVSKWQNRHLFGSCWKDILFEADIDAYLTRIRISRVADIDTVYFLVNEMIIQWSFLVPLIAGRYHIIPQLAVYTTYIPLIYCLLGDYISPTTY